jgi:hypothetical protein
MQHQVPFNLCLDTVEFVATQTIKVNPKSQSEASKSMHELGFFTHPDFKVSFKTSSRTLG